MSNETHQRLDRSLSQILEHLVVGASIAAFYLAKHTSKPHFRAKAEGRTIEGSDTCVTIANLITIMRVVLVPVIVWAMLSDEMQFAFFVFLLAGLSDAVDGAVARTFNQQTEFGTFLDPIADKIMLVSVFVVLTYMGHLPLWLTILVVSRDLLIINGVMLAFVLSVDVKIAPLWVSKANTVAQIVLAALVLGVLAFQFDWPRTVLMMEWLTGILTALSAMAYIVQGVRVFSANEPSANN